MSPGRRSRRNLRGSVRIDLNVAPVAAALAGTPARGSIVGVGLTGTPQDAAVLLLGYDPIHLPVPVISFGALLCVPALTSGPLLIPPGGVLAFPLYLPPSWPLDQAIHAQFLTVTPGFPNLRASNSLVVLVKS